LIRLRHEVEQLPAGDPNRTGLLDSWRRLHENLLEDSLGKNPERYSDLFLYEKSRFRRGFVDQAQVEEGDFIANSGAVFHRAALQHLKINYEDNSGESWTNGWGDAAVRLLTVHLSQASLLTLDLEGILSRDRATIRALLTSPGLSRLTHLNLECCEIDDGMLEVLAASPYLSNLRALNLWDNPITDRGLEALLASSTLRSLRTVDLGSRSEWEISEDIYEECQKRFGASTPYSQWAERWEGPDSDDSRGR
jgi:hypothetical protein